MPLGDIDSESGLLAIEKERAKAQLNDRTLKLDTDGCENLLQGREIFTHAPWELGELAAAREELNATKNKLDDKELSVWAKHTRFMNRAAEVLPHLRQAVKPELCTNAWTKMYECIVAFDLLPESAARRGSRGAHASVMTAHLCEAPGAFICAVNHYIQSHRPSWNWFWMGMTLNPYYEGNDRNKMIDDDVFIRTTLRNWCFGADDTGDIRRPENISAAWRQADEMCAMHGCAGVTTAATDATAAAADLRFGNDVVRLVTADGSIDCQENPNEQERTTAALHYAEIVAAIGLLGRGGAFVLKTFTLFEHSSVCALALLSSCFDALHVFKPATSKPGNSETYVIAKGFKGVTGEVLHKLLQHVDISTHSTAAMLPQHVLPAHFVESAVRCAVFFARVQRDVIELNIALQQHMSTAQRNALISAKRWFARHWVRHFEVRHVAPSRFVVAQQQAHDRHRHHHDHHSTHRAQHAQHDKPPAHTSQRVVHAANTQSSSSHLVRPRHGTLQQRREWYNQYRRHSTGQQLESSLVTEDSPSPEASAMPRATSAQQESTWSRGGKAAIHAGGMPFTPTPAMAIGKSRGTRHKHAVARHGSYPPPQPQHELPNDGSSSFGRNSFSQLWQLANDD